VREHPSVRDATPEISTLRFGASSRSERTSGRANIELVTKADLHKLVDELPDSAVEGAGVLLRGIVAGPIDPDQAWFRTPQWQAKEREADADKAAGRVERFESDEAFRAALDERRGSSDADV
jgi:antitoxin PrlF